MPEFQTIACRVSDTTPLTDMQKELPSSFQGECEEEALNHKPGHSNGECEEEALNHKPGHSNMKLVGTWHTPEQFVEKARHAVHPMDENAVAEVTKRAIDFAERSHPKLVSVERRKQLLKAKIKAKQLEMQEEALHESLHPKWFMIRKCSCGNPFCRKKARMTWQ